MFDTMITRFRGEYTLSTATDQLDLAVIHHFLSTRSYWANGIPEATVRRSLEHSLCFGMYCQGRQVGFARVISDYATFAYLADVFVLEEHRGRGLSKWMMAEIVAHPALQGLRRWVLATADAHALYAGHGFRPMARPERWMERHDPDVYQVG